MDSSLDHREPVKGKRRPARVSTPPSLRLNGHPGDIQAAGQPVSRDVGSRESLSVDPNASDQPYRHPGVSTSVSGQASTATPHQVTSSPASKAKLFGGGSGTGNWFSNLMSSVGSGHNDGQGPLNSQNKPQAGSTRRSVSPSDDDVASTYSYSTLASASTSTSRSPSKLLRRSSKQPGASLTPRSSHDSAHHGPQDPPQPPRRATVQTRMNGFDRMLDRAIQYFTDADSNVDRCPDDIWLLGVRHTGWREASQDAAASSLSSAGQRRRPNDHGVGGLPDQASQQQSRSRARKVLGMRSPRSNGEKRRLGKSSSRSIADVEEEEDTVTVENSERASASPSPLPRSKSAAFFAALKPGSSNPPSQHAPTNVSSVPIPTRRSSTSTHSSGTSQSLSRVSSSSISSSAATRERLSPPLTPSSPTPVFSPNGPADSTAPFNTHGWPSDFYSDFYSRIQLTYRSDFPPIPCASLGPSSSTSTTTTSAVAGAWNSVVNGLSASFSRSTGLASSRAEGLSSDSGWGCMLRTGQSLLANTLLHLHLGRDWRHPLAEIADRLASSATFHTYVRLISWFLDDPGSTHPFSVHKFAAEGEKLGKAVGEWFGPSTAAGAIKALTTAFEPARLSVVSSMDTTVYKSEILQAAGCDRQSAQWRKPVLILIPLRLGINGVNPVYFDAIKHYFTLPQCVGIAGGRPSSSYYFVGAQADSLFYIDPHHTRPAVPACRIPPELQQAASTIPLSSRDAQLSRFFSSAYSPGDLLSFHCDKVRKMPLSALDPSMLVGLLCKDQNDWDDLTARMRELPKSTTRMIHIMEEMPAWMRKPSRTLSTTNAAAAKQKAAAAESEHVSGPSLRGPDANWNQATGPGAVDIVRHSLVGSSPERVPSIDYADSDDWDIDESDQEDSMFVENEGDIANDSELVDTPDKIVGARTVSRASPDDDEWTHPASQEGSSSTFRNAASGTQARTSTIPITRNDEDDMDAVIVVPSPAELHHDQLPMPPAKASLDFVEREAGWEGIRRISRAETQKGGEGVEGGDRDGLFGDVAARLRNISTDSQSTQRPLRESESDA